MKIRRFRGLVLPILFFTYSSFAATYTVTNSADVNYGGTLRWAINSANTNPGLDTIGFNLSSTTISPTGALPSLTDYDGSVVIDGTTQTGYSDTPLVKLVGINAGSTDGLYINTPSNVVKGLIITRFQGSGIGIVQGHNVIAGNYIISNSEHGVYLQSGAHENTIGGTNAANRNVISGNKNDGVYMYGENVVQNTILGNYIGVDPTGLLNNSNGWWGVVVMAPSNRIGSAGGGRNVITANGYAAITLGGSYGHHNIVEGNYCGVGADGSTAYASVSGLQLSGASNNVIGGTNAGAGNVFSGHVNYGIEFQVACHGNVVLGNFIGTDAAGTSIVSNRYEGLVIAADCGGNQIGGDDASGRNIIAGNGANGIYVGANTGMVIRGNYIGISTNGSRLANGTSGIYLLNCNRVTIGGTNDAARNVIAGNRGGGIWISGGVSNTVRYNTIGLNAAGAAVSNNLHGVYVYSSRGHEITDNLISGNGVNGIYLQGATHCTLKRNRVGTDPAGAASRGNGSAGLLLQDNSVNNQIGGRWADEGNVFSGNEYNGILIQTESTSNVIKGNRVGADINGMAVVPNGSDGILIEDVPFTVIGSTNGSERNVISGNDIVGVDLSGTNAHDNRIMGNYIGVDATGTNELPNLSGGMWIHLDASSNTVGGILAGAGNRIAYNGGSGIQVESGVANSIISNSFFRNGTMGIDLGLGTPTANDTGDPDLGPNRCQNYPVLVSVSNNGSQIRVVWTLDSVTNDPFRIEFYGSTGPDLTTYGEGEYSLGLVGPYTMPATGLLGGTNFFTTPNPPPNFITALAHHATLLDTSEFSKRIMLDSDNDGMPDGYETIYFNGYTNGEPNAHYDGDMISNIDEFRADTDPIDGGSFLRVKEVVLTGDTVVTIAKCSRERNYQLQYCTNLHLASPQWNVLSTTLRYSGEDGRFPAKATNGANFRLTSWAP